MRQTIVGVLACLAALVALPGTAQDEGGDGESGGEKKPPPPTVEVASPVLESIVEYDEFTGRFLAQQEVEVRARVSGYVDRVAFREGEIVREGELLYRIDPRPFEAEVAGAEAALRAASARRDLARVEAERARTLAQRKVGSVQDFDQARASYAETVANVAVARATLDAAQLELDYTTIRAPIGGRISATEVDRGNLVMAGGAGGAPLASIVTLDPIEFVFTVSEADYLRYTRLARRGERTSARDAQIPVSLQLMDEDGWARRGRMTFVSNRLDPNSGTIEGRATVENPDLLLTPGLFGRVRLEGTGRYEAVLIPDEAIFADQARRLVYVVGDDDKAAEQVVETGPLHDGLRVIRKGLDGSERVIVRGIQRAQPDKPVTPKPVEIGAGGEILSAEGSGGSQGEGGQGGGAPDAAGG